MDVITKKKRIETELLAALLFLFFPYYLLFYWRSLFKFIEKVPGEIIHLGLTCNVMKYISVR